MASLLWYFKRVFLTRTQYITLRFSIRLGLNPEGSLYDIGVWGPKSMFRYVDPYPKGPCSQIVYTLALK